MRATLYVDDDDAIAAKAMHHKAWAGPAGCEFPARTLVHVDIDAATLVLSEDRARALRDALDAALAEQPTAEGGAR